MMETNECALWADSRHFEWSCGHGVRAEKFLRAIPDLMFLLDRDGKYLDFHPGKNIRPYVPPEEFLGRRVREVLPENVAEPCQYLITVALAMREVQYLEYQLSMDGVPHKYEARIVPSEPG